jgi:hypothetical protein
MNRARLLVDEDPSIVTLERKEPDGFILKLVRGRVSP